MNTIFFHDTTFVCSNNKYYTFGTMNAEKFNQYAEKFGNITAVVRVVKENQNNKKAVRNENFVGNIKVQGVSKYYSNCIKVVKEQMKNCDFAIIRMHSIIGIIACKEARKRKIPYMIEMVGCPKDALWYHGGIKYKLAMPFLAIMNKIELKKSKYTIYVTEKFLQKRYPTKGKYISCSDVELQKNSNNVLENRIKKIQLKKDTDTYKFGIIGSLNVNFKGHETAIKALSMIRDKINFELHFLGAGEKEKWISMARKYNIDKHIFFDGILPHNEVYSWIDNLDVYLIPSLQEGLPRALIEAMSRGCPCIGSNVGGIPELLEDQYIIDKKNYKELANKIIKLIDNKEEMKKISKKNFEKSLKFEKKELNYKRNNFYDLILKEI